MKHDDTTLQAAIDAAMLETGKQVSAKNFAVCPKYYRMAWPEEATARLALAKTFLAKLPEVQPILADDGRSLGQVAKEAFIGAPGLTDDWMNAAAQAVANVVLAQAVRRMEAVHWRELKHVSYENIRARLIAAARGEGQAMAKNIPGDKCPLCGAEEVESNTPRTTYACGSSDYDGRPETFHPGDQCDGPRVVVNEPPQGEKQPDLSGENEKQDPYARLKAYAKAGARIRFEQGQWFENSNWSWSHPIDFYEVHPDDLHLCPEYAPQYPDPVSSWSKVDEEVHPDAQENWNQYAEKPAWTLPSPPAGHKWHRDDWTQDMLPEGYRPLLNGEIRELVDEWSYDGLQWSSVYEYGPAGDTVGPAFAWHRTRRSLPSWSQVIAELREMAKVAGVERWEAALAKLQPFIKP